MEEDDPRAVLHDVSQPAQGTDSEDDQSSKYDLNDEEGKVLVYQNATSGKDLHGNKALSVGEEKPEEDGREGLDHHEMLSGSDEKEENDDQGVVEESEGCPETEQVGEGQLAREEEHDSSADQPQVSDQDLACENEIVETKSGQRNGIENPESLEREDAERVCNGDPFHRREEDQARLAHKESEGD